MQLGQQLVDAQGPLHVAVQLEDHLGHRLHGEARRDRAPDRPLGVGQAVEALPLRFFVANLLGAVCYVPWPVLAGYGVGFGLGGWVEALRRKMRLEEDLIFFVVVLAVTGSLVILRTRRRRRRTPRAPV